MAHLREISYIRIHTQNAGKYESMKWILKLYDNLLKKCLTSQNRTRFRVLVAVFLDVILYNLVDIYQHFRGTCCFHLQGGRKELFYYEDYLKMA
jgi:hypothetical protein